MSKFYSVSSCNVKTIILLVLKLSQIFFLFSRVIHVFVIDIFWYATNLFRLFDEKKIELQFHRITPTFIAFPMRSKKSMKFFTIENYENFLLRVPRCGPRRMSLTPRIALRNRVYYLFVARLCLLFKMKMNVNVPYD